MYIALIIFFISLMLGQLGAIPIIPGVTVYAHDILITVLLITGILRAYKRKTFVRPVLFWPIIVFAAVALTSLIVNAYRFETKALIESSLYFFRWVAYAGLYIVLVQERMNPSLLLMGLFGFGSGISTLGLVQYFLYPELRNLSYLGWDPHYYRLFSTLLDPNFTGMIIVLTLFIGTFVWKKTKQRSIWVAQMVNIIALYLTYSRSSYGALIAGGIAYVIFYKQWKTCIYIMLFVLALVLIPKPGGKTLLLTRMDSTLSRVGNWQESVGIIAQSPLFGHGFNTLRYIPRKAEYISPDGDVSHARAGLDSSILFLLATTGALGTFAYGWIIYSLMRFYRIHTVLHDQFGVLISVFTALAVHSLFSNSLFYAWVMLWIWIFVAAGEWGVNKKK
jgi:hypothetical protein